jgi:site-specific DNA-methyltransferase (adenine-specific)
MDNPISLVFDVTSPQYQQVHQTKLGTLFQGDCLPFMFDLPDASIDMVFADPPFNLGKNYGSGISDEKKDADYLDWSRSWLKECIRILKPGGSLFVFNLPRWLIDYGAFLNQEGMMFRHWIACRMPKTFPRGKRLSPSHYGLLYYTKGEPKTFNKVYIPIPVCRHCGGEIRDYGGHRDKLNPQGLNLMDVIEQETDVWDLSSKYQTPLEDLWEDIPPVRHSQYKVRGANELAPILLERLIMVASNLGDIVFDPFGGSGTTYYAAEKLERRWLGIELGDTDPAVRRLKDFANGDVIEWESARRTPGPKQRSPSTKKAPKKKEPPQVQVLPLFAYEE